MSFYWLLRSKKADYDHIMRETIRCGGDTDTNACIVGGMVGAALGYSRIPTRHVGKIFQFDCLKMTNGNRKTQRPEFLSTKIHGARLMATLVERRCQPGDKLEILNDFDPYAD
jgi:hypothetical protein